MRWHAARSGVQKGTLLSDGVAARSDRQTFGGGPVCGWRFLWLFVAVAVGFPPDI